MHGPQPIWNKQPRQAKICLAPKSSQLQKASTNHTWLLETSTMYIAKIGVRYPKIFPEILPEEESVRSAGHIIQTRLEYLQLLLSFPDHLFIAKAVRTLEDLSIFNPQHPLLVNLVKMLEYVCFL